MKKITIIVPLHEYNEKVQKYLDRAMKSVNQDKHGVIFVGPKDVITEAAKNYSNITLVENEDSDFFTQINKAAFKCVTPYFSILEYDDEYLPIWDNVYETEELGGKTIVIPFIEKYRDDKFIAFGNEIAWDVAFIEKDGVIGVLTESELKTYADFNVTGGIIKTEDFISLGGFKTEFKYLAWFEFLMRAVREGKVFYVIPRVCYRHRIFREGSYMTIADKELTHEEAETKMKEILGTEEENNE